MIEGRVITENINLQNEKWPDKFSCRPLKGDFIMSVEHKKAEVLSITHCTKTIEESTQYSHRVIHSPYVIITVV